MAYSPKQMKEALSTKITSMEQLNEIIVAAYPTNNTYVPAEGRRSEYSSLISQAYRPTPPDRDIAWQDPAFGSDWACSVVVSARRQMPDKSRWWLMREWLRLYYGVYSTTSPLWNTTFHLRLADFAPHCARDGTDPSMIAFTPDPEAGAADKQLRTTLSKFVRKFCPSLPDHVLRDIEASHRADLSNEIEILTGVSEIVDAYLTGPSSCMSHKVSDYAGKIHPAGVYAAPGMGVAVIRSADGRITARSVVYQNPDDEKDKRFVRVYGDAMLQRRLLRNGYVCAGLAGARLRRIDADPKVIGISRATDTRMGLIVPYIDPPGGSSSGSRDKFAQYAVIGDEWLHMLGEKEANDLMRKLPHKTLAPVSATNGLVVLDRATAVFESDLKQTCCISGEPISLMDLGAKAAQVYMNGEVRTALLDRVSDLPMAVTLVGGMRTNVRFTAGTATTEFGGAFVIDTPENRRHIMGQVRLSRGLYPDSDWMSVHKVVDLTDHHPFLDEDEELPEEIDWSYTDTTGPVYVRDEDLVDLVIGTTYYVVHEKMVRDIGQYELIHRLHSARRMYARADSPHLVRTNTGRRVIPNIHPVIEYPGGIWGFSSSTEFVNLIGVEVPYSTVGSTGPEVPSLANDDVRAFVKRKIIESATAGINVNARVKSFVESQLRYNNAFVIWQASSGVVRCPVVYAGAYEGESRYDAVARAVDRLNAGRFTEHDVVKEDGWGSSLDVMTCIRNAKFLVEVVREVTGETSTCAPLVTAAAEPERFTVSV